MADSHLQKLTPSGTLQPSTPLPSTPLHLSGFLSGDTIQVEGDAGDLQFSVQFKIHKKKYFSHNQFQFPGPKVSLENNNYSFDHSSFSSYLTPNNSSHDEKEHQNAYRDPLDTVNLETEETGECENRKREAIVTRLKTGVISPVKYFPRISGNSCASVRSSRIVKLRKTKRRGKPEDMLQRVLRRHSSPIRPCSSYTFFVMDTWGLIESSSFGESSKKLGQMWYKLPHTEKKIYEDMALKDRARYKRQRILMKSKEQEGSTSDYP